MSRETLALWGFLTDLAELDELRAVHFTRSCLASSKGRKVQENLAKTLHLSSDSREVVEVFSRP